MIKSNIEYSIRFVKSDPKNMSDGGKYLLRTVKSHLELHKELNYTLSPEELHPEGSEFSKFPVADSFLNKLSNLYKGNPKKRYDLSP